MRPHPLHLCLLLAAVLGATCARAADPALDAALLEAVVYHEPDRVADLLGRGASRGARNGDGVTVLELAVREAARASAPDTLAVVERLLAAGATPNLAIAEDHPEPMIATAIQAGATELLELLLRFDADPDVVGLYGAVPLHSAVDQDDAALVRILLAHGADPGYRTAEGTVRDYAESRGASDEVLALLR
jgi:ankyrin repeat protein